MLYEHFQIQYDHILEQLQAKSPAHTRIADLDEEYGEQLTEYLLNANMVYRGEVEDFARWVREQAKRN